MNEIMSIIDSDTRPFWEGTLKNKLMIQYCTHCSEFQFYPRIVCKNCMGNVDWRQASGEGSIYSYTVVERTFNRCFSEKVPYIVALIELKEGPRLMSNMIHINKKEVKIGLKVQAVFNQEYGDYKLLQFAPV